MEFSEEILGADLQQGGPEERALLYVTGCRQFNPANINTYGDLLMLNFWRERGGEVESTTVGYDTVVEFMRRNPSLTIYYSTETSFNLKTFPKTKFHSIPLHLFQPTNTHLNVKPLLTIAKEKLKPPLQKALKHVQDERDQGMFLDALFRRRPDLVIPRGARYTNAPETPVVQSTPVVDVQVTSSALPPAVDDNHLDAAFLDLFTEDNPDPFGAMDYENIRTRVRQCKCVRDFLVMYENREFMSVLSHLRDQQAGYDRETWAAQWARRLADRDPWALALNDSRITVSLYLFELCDWWNNQEDRTTSARDIVEELGDTKIKQMVKLSLVMDRANVMYNMLEAQGNRRGMHWFSDKTAHRELLAEQGVFVPYGLYTMNKRYLWLLEDPAFEDLGLWRDAELQKWMTPERAPGLKNCQSIS